MGKIELKVSSIKKIKERKEWKTFQAIPRFG